ncbi:hypothetical protein [Caudoviricetes sp.]|nr:hypothetical protein [Caudoviricetes sp.]
MQTYTDLSKLYATKAKRYTVAQCRTAIVDIDATLKLQGDFVVMNDYVTKLFCERDAMLDRLLSLR